MSIVNFKVKTTLEKIFKRSIETSRAIN